MTTTIPRRPRTTGALSRRGFLGAAGGSLGAAGLVTACSSGSSDDEQTGGSDGAGSGGWSFTDDRGETATLDAAPERIVAYVGSAAALHDYGIRCTGIFGPAITADGEPSVLTPTWTWTGSPTWATPGASSISRSTWPRPPTAGQRHPHPAEPVVGLRGHRLRHPGHRAKRRHSQRRPPAGHHGRALRRVGRGAGCDLSSPDVVAARERYDAAAEAIRQAARDNPGIRVLALSATADKVWFCVPADLSDLTYYQELGVELVVPEDPDEAGTFQSVSWENAGLNPADLILLDDRAISLQPDQLAADKPTWRSLLAVQAGQVAAWNPEPTYSYAGCAPAMENLAEAIRSATRLG
ncbi:ABC transporter substrate-binding protein [Streptomyces sp. 8K308]|uniref:ABC transporter substrate-binding protein n=1 Tax=Streptomyces sp. 8K308 TaxID=2530388 RepID=UPI001FB56F52|nr:ABC transporter substrate-binding protein [Streptomyces sp. 8K308]